MVHTTRAIYCCERFRLLWWSLRPAESPRRVRAAAVFPAPTPKKIKKCLDRCPTLCHDKGGDVMTKDDPIVNQVVRQLARSARITFDRIVWVSHRWNMHWLRQAFPSWRKYIE
jgi:hypothetical protein